MKMSPKLQGEVLLQTNGLWIREVRRSSQLLTLTLTRWPSHGPPMAVPWPPMALQWPSGDPLMTLRGPARLTRLLPPRLPPRGQVPWLANEDPRFVVDVILALRPAVFAPDELVRSSALHIVLSGLAITNGRLIRNGCVWGVDMLLAAAHLRSRTLVRAITYVEVSYLDRDTALRLASQFSESYQRIQRHLRFLALRRYVVLIAKASRSLGQRQQQARACPPPPCR